MNEAYLQLAPQVGVAAACMALEMNRSGVYRERARSLRGARVGPPRRRPRPPLSQSMAEQQLLLGILDSERFVDLAQRCLCNAAR